MNFAVKLLPNLLVIDSKNFLNYEEEIVAASRAPKFKFLDADLCSPRGGLHFHN